MANVLYEQMRNGINEYYNKMRFEKKRTREHPAPATNFENLRVTLKFSSHLSNLIDRFCQLVNREKQDLFVELVTWNIMEVYQEEEIFLDYFDDLDALLDQIGREIASL
jgi:hypothetical protein